MPFAYCHFLPLFLRHAAAAAAAYRLYDAATGYAITRQRYYVMSIRRHA